MVIQCDMAAKFDTLSHRCHPLSVRRNEASSGDTSCVCASGVHCTKAGQKVLWDPEGTQFMLAISGMKGVAVA